MRVIARLPSKANCSTRVPGIPNWSRSADYVRRDQAQVLRDERQAAQLVLHGAEKFSAGAGHPFAGFRGRRSRRYVPGGRERAEMIQADQVHVSQQRAESVDPPGIAGPAMRLPVVDRVAPELPCG